MPDGDDGPITRRRLLGGAAGAAGLVALAGCTTSEEQKQAMNQAQQQASTDPPTPPSATPENEVWQYVVDSLEYQNQQAKAQTEALAALTEKEFGGDGGE